MRSISVLLLNLLLLVASTGCAPLGGGAAKEGAAPECPFGPEWTFVSAFSDEFNGDRLDGTKWHDHNPNWIGRRPGIFSTNNVAVRDGRLVLTASLQRPGEIPEDVRSRGYDKYCTATIKSLMKIRYGYFEARCRSMKARVCNAFWLYDPLGDRPDLKLAPGSTSDEIDIFEVFGEPRSNAFDRVCFMTVHSLKTPYRESLENGGSIALPDSQGYFHAPYDFWADDHVYGFAWTPKELIWFIDGRPVRTRPNDIFHRGLYLVFDCEIMAEWIGEPLPGQLPADFSIDYVRVWQRAADAAGTR